MGTQKNGLNETFLLSNQHKCLIGNPVFCVSDQIRLNLANSARILKFGTKISEYQRSRSVCAGAQTGLRFCTSHASKSNIFATNFKYNGRVPSAYP